MTDIFTPKEAAAYIKHSESTLATWRYAGIGPIYHKPARKIVYYKKDLDDWIKSGGGNK